MLFGKPEKPPGDLKIIITVGEEQSTTAMEGWCDPVAALATLTDSYMKLTEVLVKEHSRHCQEKECHLAMIYASIRQGIEKTVESHHRMHGDKKEQK